MINRRQNNVYNFLKSLDQFAAALKSARQEINSHQVSVSDRRSKEYFIFEYEILFVNTGRSGTNIFNISITYHLTSNSSTHQRHTKRGTMKHPLYKNPR